MSANKFKFLIPTFGIVGMLAGGAAAYLYLKGTFSDAYSPLASAKLVPDEALMAAFISTDTKPWSQLQQFGTPEAQKLVETGLQNLNQQVLDQSNIDYEKDLKPWVGSVTIAMLPPNSVQVASATAPLEQAPDFLMVVGIKDKFSASNFANKLKADKTVYTQEFNYKGEKITETIGKGEATYSAVLNNHLVVAAERQVVEQAIDTFKGERSFASKDSVNSILTKGVDLKNPIVQIYLPDYADAVQQLMGSNLGATQLPPETLAQLQQVKNVVAGIGIDEAGIRMKAIAKLDPAMQVDYQPSSGKIVSHFPADTIALITGSGINRYWTAFVNQTKNISEVNLALDSARQNLNLFNLDLDKDIFGWMDGEFAFAAIPSDRDLLAAVGFGGALVFDTSDRVSAEATFNKLDAIAKGNSIAVASRSIHDKTVTEWQVPFQGALLAHGWLDRDTVFIALGGPIADALATPSSQSLDSSETFKAVTNSLQQPNGGYFYLNIDKTLSLATRFAAQGQVVPPETSAVLNSIHGIGMTANSPDKFTSEMELLVALKSRRS